jgi:hypothetical protein
MGPLSVVGAADAKDEKEAEKTIEISDKTAIFLVILNINGREEILRLTMILPSTDISLRHK